MSDLHVVILAAWESGRTTSAPPNVLQPLSGRPLIVHVLHTLRALAPRTTTIVAGDAADSVKSALVADWPGVQFTRQAPYAGAVGGLCETESLLGHASGTLLVLSGHAPLVTAATLGRILDAHTAHLSAATIATTQGAGAPDAEPNGDVYAMALSGLFAALGRLNVDRPQSISLSDLLALLRREKRKVASLVVEDANELRCVSTRVDLAELSAVVRERKNRSVMLSGVTLDDPSTTYIDEDVIIGQGSTIGPSVRLEARTSVGAECRIHAGSRLTNATLGNHVTVLDHTVIVDSRVGDSASIGPFAHLRPQSDVGASAKVGNFVELKKTRLGARSKASHLAYLGDATIGTDVNVGAGTITCNYDGERKNPTIIEDGAFIGSDSQLVAPVVIGAGAYVAAGSSITRDVPPGALGVARASQVNKDGWVKKRRENSR
jgi:bifunctional UDP-N-acetylglucosamine pyrophosphorylase/glucosamine-1-phosphate N-acetyltransferase